MIEYPSAAIEPAEPGELSALVAAVSNCESLAMFARPDRLGSEFFGLCSANDTTVWLRHDSTGTHYGVGRHSQADWACRPVREHELIECRLFNTSAELHMWLGGDGWAGRWCATALTVDRQFAPLKERMLLLGTAQRSDGEGFTLMVGRNGRRHIVPIPVTGGHRAELRSIVHLGHNPDTGQLFRGLTVFTGLGAATQGAST